MAYDLVVVSLLIVRPARVQDVAQMARVHVRCWQETYRGLMPDAVLDDPGFPAARERMWTEVLTSERYRGHHVAVAERDGELAGIAMSGPPEDAAAAWTRQLYVLPFLARRRFTASTASPLTGRPGPGTGSGRSAWCAACSTTRPTAPTACNPCVAAPAGETSRTAHLAVKGAGPDQAGIEAVRFGRPDSSRHGGSS